MIIILVTRARQPFAKCTRLFRHVPHSRSYDELELSTIRIHVDTDDGVDDDGVGIALSFGGCNGVPSSSPNVPPLKPASITLVNNRASLTFLLVSA